MPLPYMFTSTIIHSFFRRSRCYYCCFWTNFEWSWKLYFLQLLNVHAQTTSMNGTYVSFSFFNSLIEDSCCLSSEKDFSGYLVNDLQPNAFRVTEMSSEKWANSAKINENWSDKQWHKCPQESKTAFNYIQFGKYNVLMSVCI